MLNVWCYCLGIWMGFLLGKEFYKGKGGREE